MRTLVVVPWEDDPQDQYLLAPEGVGPAEAELLVNQLLDDYDWDDEYQPISFLLGNGFDLAEFCVSNPI